MKVAGPRSGRRSRTKSGPVQRTVGHLGVIRGANERSPGVTAAPPEGHDPRLSAHHEHPPPFDHSHNASFRLQLLKRHHLRPVQRAKLPCRAVHHHSSPKHEVATEVRCAEDQPHTCEPETECKTSLVRGPCKQGHPLERERDEVRVLTPINRDGRSDGGIHIRAPMHEPHSPVLAVTDHPVGDAARDRDAASRAKPTEQERKLLVAAPEVGDACREPEPDGQVGCGGV